MPYSNLIRKRPVSKNKGKFKIPNLEHRVVLTSAKGENTEFFTLIKDEFYKNFTTIQDKKIAKLTRDQVEKGELSQLKEDKNEWSSGICNNAGGPRGYHAE